MFHIPFIKRPPSVDYNVAYCICRDKEAFAVKSAAHKWHCLYSLSLSGWAVRRCWSEAARLEWINSGQ